MTEAADPFRRLAAMSAGRFSDGTSAPPLVRGVGETDAPLTFFQEMRWNRLRLDPFDRYFLDGFAQRLVGPLDRAALEWSLEQLVARHDVLRMTFDMARPVATIAARGGVELRVHDVRGATLAEADARAVELLLAPLDITREPSFRPQLLQLADDDHVLVFGYHNFAMNRPAVELLVADWAAFYGAKRAGMELPPPRTTYQFSDFARWQRAWLSGAELDRRLARAKARLAGGKPIQLPTDQPRPPEPVPCRLGTHDFSLPPELARDVIAFSRQRSTTFSTTLAAFAALLHHRTGVTEMTLKTVAHTLHRATFGMVGMLACLALVRIELGDDPPLSVLGQRVTGALLDALEDQFLPWYQLPESLIAVPDVVVDAATPIHHALVWPELTATRREVGHFNQRPGRFDLECFVWLRGERDQYFGFEYNADLFTPETIATLGRDHHRILRAMIDVPDQRVSRALT